MRFEFATASRIVFGPGTLTDVGRLLVEMQHPVVGKALVVTGRHPERAARLQSVLEETGVGTVSFAVPGEPTVELAREGTTLARGEQVQIVIGFGGGSAIDAAKAIAVLATNAGDPLDYLEVIGRGRPLSVESLPCIAIPTTAGTGSEVTRNAVLLSAEHRVKVSLRSASMLPRVALVDPELTYDLPPAITAATGLDALAQLIEPFVSCRAQPMTDALCREGIARVARSLRRACAGGDCPQARENMSLAALFGGLALANAGLGAVHGFAGPMGGMFPAAPHGAVCAALLPHVMEANIRALQHREGGQVALQRYAEVACLVTGRADAAMADGITWMGELVHDLQIPPLRTYGLQESDIDALVAKAATASSMKGNPVALTPAELREIVQQAM